MYRPSDVEDTSGDESDDYGTNNTARTSEIFGVAEPLSFRSHRMRESHNKWEDDEEESESGALVVFGKFCMF